MQQVILSSSMAEHPAVNRVVVGSSPTWGAKNPKPNDFGFFCISPQAGGPAWGYPSAIAARFYRPEKWYVQKQWPYH